MVRMALRAFAVALSIVVFCGADARAAVSFANAPARALVAGESEMRLDREQQSLTGTHRHYTQYIGGVRVAGGVRSETLLPEGAIRVNFDHTAQSVSPEFSPRVSDFSASSVESDPSAIPERVYVNVDGTARLALRTVALTRPLEPRARYIDVATGALLRDDPLFYTVKARVFDVNPVARLNAPSLRDDNDSAAAVPEAAYSEVDLSGLLAGDVLAGPNAQIVDVQAPFTPHANPSSGLEFNRSEPQFEEVNAYFQIDRAQRYLQSLGYAGPKRIVAYSIPIDPHAANGTDNSYYLQGTTIGQGTLYFGDGGTQDAEDSDIMLHEFMHAIHDWIVPGALTGTSSSQSRAVSEGLGDYWSFSSTYSATKASGRDPFCIGDWDARCAGDDPSRNCGYPAGADCLRRVDSTKTMRDFINSDAAGTEHVNGEIWSSALREIFMTLAGRHGVETGKRITDMIVVESLFGLPPLPDFLTVTRSMVAADRLLRGGADVDAICSAMTARGIVTAADCGGVPRGEWTLIQSGDHNVAIPDGTASIVATVNVTDNRTIARLAVRVDIVHPSRGDLAITLVAPDGTRVRLKEPSSVDRTPDVHATFGIDAASAQSLAVLNGLAANGVWQLIVSDVYEGDAGALQNWALEIDFADDTPLLQRPATSGARIIVPIVAHAIGVTGTTFKSDVDILNRGNRDEVATLIFTPAEADGRTDFAAVKVMIAAGQTVSMRNVVATLFETTGTGALEIAGSGSSLLVSSRAVNVTPTGRISQTVEAVSSNDSVGAGDAPLELFPLFPNGGWRTNFGLAETAGESGLVRLLIRTASGTLLGQSVFSVAPYSHLQVPITVPLDPSTFATVSILSGAARVIAYASAVDNSSGDAMTVVGHRASLSTTDAVVPVVASATGIGGKQWMTEAWSVNLRRAEDEETNDLRGAAILFYPSGRSAAVAPVGPPPNLTSYVNNTLVTDFAQFESVTGHFEMTIPPKVLVATRTYTPLAGGGSVGQLIQTVPVANAIGAGSAVDALAVESSAASRTNFGISEVSGSDVEVRVTLRSGGGAVLARTSLSLPAHQHRQLPVTSLYSGELSGARLHFEVTGGGGRIVAYASVLDSVTGDPFFVLAR